MKRLWKFFDSISNTKLLLIIIIISIVLQIGFSYRLLHNADIKSPTVWMDDWDYINYSKAIFNGIFLHTNFDISESEQYRIDEVPPLYPIILSVFYGVVGYSNLRLIVILNILVTILSIYLLYLISCFLYKGKLSLLPSFLWSVYFNSLIYSGHALKEPFITFFILLIIYLICRINQKFRYWDIVSLGIVNVLFAHLDERYLFMSVLSLIFVVVILISQNKRVYIWRAALLYITLCIILMSPWMVRNYLRYDKVVLITPRTAIITDKIFGYTNTNNAIVDLNGYVSPQQVDSIISGYKLATVDTFMQKNIIQAHEYGLKPRQYSLWERLYFNTISFWQLFYMKPFLMGSGYKVNPVWGDRYTLIIIVQFTLFLLLSLYALYDGIRQKHLILLLFLSILIINTIQHAFLGAGLSRYRSVMDPLIYVAACYTIDRFFHRKTL